MLRRYFTAALLSALAVTLCPGSALEAAKPSGGGGGGSAPGGTVYFTYGLELHAMDANGSDKRSLTIQWGYPSRLPHGGARWFLQSRAIPHEYYPNGNPRREVFAVREGDGFAVQLTSDPALQHYLMWGPGETESTAVVGGFGRRWDLSTGQVVAGSVGVYEGGVIFDAAGIPSLTAAPGFVVSVGEVIEDDGHPDVDAYSDFDWSPDGARVVVDRRDRSALRVVTTATGEATTVVSGASWYPAWSPDGTKIVFTGFGKFGNEICVINADGSGRKAVAKDTVSTYVERAHWSPDSQYLVFMQGPHGGLELDIYRMTASGSGKTNLTGDLSSYAYAIGWR